MRYHMLGFVYCCILLEDKQKYVHIPIIGCMFLKVHSCFKKAVIAIINLWLTQE